VLADAAGFPAANEFQELTKAAMKRGFQTSDAAMDLARLVGDLDEHGMNEVQHTE
jgi:hypothetical protein